MDIDKKLQSDSIKKMWKDIKKSIFIIFSWILILILSLIFIEINKSIIVGGWLLITSLVILINGKKYEKWYYWNYNNIRNVELNIYKKNKI